MVGGRVRTDPPRSHAVVETCLPSRAGHPRRPGHTTPAHTRTSGTQHRRTQGRPGTQLPQRPRTRNGTTHQHPTPAGTTTQERPPTPHITGPRRATAPTSGRVTKLPMGAHLALSKHRSPLLPPAPRRHPSTLPMVPRGGPRAASPSEVTRLTGPTQSTARPRPGQDRY